MGFESIGQRRYQHFFAQPGSSVIVTLRRDINARPGDAIDSVSLASIDEAGRVYASCSDPLDAKRLADAHPMFKIQSVEAGDVGKALLCHQQFVQTHVGEQRRLLDASQGTVAMKHLHEVTALARIRHFNEKQISFA